MDLRSLYEEAAQASLTRNPMATLYEMFGSLEVGQGYRRNPGNRALYIMQAVLAIAVESTTALSPTLMQSLLASRAATIPTFHALSEVPSVTVPSTSISISSPAASSETAESGFDSWDYQLDPAFDDTLRGFKALSFVTSESATETMSGLINDATTAQTATNTAPRPASVASPVPSPQTTRVAEVDGYDISDFTHEDRKTVGHSLTQITRVPFRIWKRVEEYSELTDSLEHWFIKRARRHRFLHLPFMTEYRFDERTGKERERIKNNASFERLGKLLVHRKRAPAINQGTKGVLRSIIKLRSFVSDWYARYRTSQ